MPKLVLANTSTATYRRVYFDLRQSDGLTPATAEAGGQPQLSVDGAAWVDSGIGVLSAIGNGRYYADLDQTSVLTAGTMIETRYKSAATLDCPGDSIHVVAFNPHDAVHLGLSAIPNADSTTVGGLPTVGTGTNQVSMDGAGNVNSNLATWTGAVPNALTTGRVDTTVGATQTGSISATALAAGAIHATAIASNAITAATIALDADTEIAASVWNAVRATYTTVGSFGEGVASVQGSITGNLAGSVGTVTGGVTVTTNNDKTGYTVAVGGIGATAFAANAVDSGAFAATAAQKVADEVLNRDLVGGSSGNTRNVRNTLRSLRNKTAIAAGTLTVYQEDDSTSAWTAAVVTTAGNPISSIDPA